MFLGKVVGTIWATRKDEELVGMKFQIVKHLGIDYKVKETFVVAVDTVQAGVGDVVLVCSGS
jgi:microcompartment protein CcmK/EutM